MPKIKGIDANRLGKDINNMKRMIYGDVATIRKKMGLKDNEALTPAKFTKAFSCSSFGAGLARCKNRR